MIVLDNFLNEYQWPVFSADENWQKKLDITWKDKKAESKNFWDQLPHIIWESEACKRYVDKKEYIGFEYWTNILSCDITLPWHQDKDEGLYDKTGKTVVPQMGCVLYGHKENIEGGYLEINHIDNGEYERIRAVPNRLVIFDAGLWHRVSKIHSGVRRTYACNIWNRQLNT